jgi:hypothetical protein
MDKIRILFRIGYIYHKAGFDPVIEYCLSDNRFDVYFSLDMEAKRWLFFDLPFRAPAIDKLKKEGYRFIDKNGKKGFDIVITGDTLRDAPEYGKTLLCFLNHGTGIKNILYRNLARVPNDRYQIFVGVTQVDSLLSSPSLGKNEVHLIGLPSSTIFFRGV